MNRAALWGLALVGSVVGNGALLALVALALNPQPVAEQPAPSTKLDVQAQEVPRETAQEQRPDAPLAREADAGGSALPSSAVPRSNARSRPLTPERSASLSAPSQRVAAIRDAAMPLASAPAPSEPGQITEAAAARVPAQSAPSVVVPAQPLRPDSTAPTSLPALKVDQLSPPGEALPDQVPTAAALAAVQNPGVSTPTLVQAGLRLAATRTTARTTQPTAAAPAELHPTQTSGVALIARSAPAATVTPVAAAAVETPAAAIPNRPALPVTGPVQTAQPVQPASDPAGQITPVAQPAAQSQGNAQRLTADLAFTGAQGDVDPLSLVAFQSFMQPGDLSRGADPLRDGVSALLAQVPCSRLQVGFDPDSATLQVNGHIPEDGLRAPVLAALQAQMGSSITVSDNILILPRPQCGALAGIGAVGLAQSTDRFTNPRVIGRDTHVKIERFVAGDLLSFDLTAPDYDAYVYVDYFDAGGNVLHLAPNDQVALIRAQAKSQFAIGVKTPQEPGLQLVIGPPFGQEIAVAFASSVPLYDGLRPIVEPAGPYLDWLTARVAQARAQHPEFKGEWIYFFISTTPG